MKGVVFQTSTAMITGNAVSGVASQASLCGMICRLARMIFTTP